MVEVGPDDGVLDDEDEDVLDEEVEVGARARTAELHVRESGVLSLPTFGRPAFEKVPLNCDGVIEVYTDGRAALHDDARHRERRVPRCHPTADASVSVTTCSLPAGDSNWYECGR